MRRPSTSRAAFAAVALALAAPALAGDFGIRATGANTPHHDFGTPAPLAATAPAASESAAMPVAPAPSSTFGASVTDERLDGLRGGDGNVSITTNRADVQGTVDGNTATNVFGGGNQIADGSFGNATGISTVIQNSGSNVLIQNSTIVNVQFVPTP